VKDLVKGFCGIGIVHDDTKQSNSVAHKIISFDKTKSVPEKRERKNEP
jgi:hypothetical protein